MEKEKILARVGDRTITGEDFNNFMILIWEQNQVLLLMEIL